MFIIPERQRWVQQPPYGGIIDSVPGMSFRASVLLPSLRRPDVTALTVYPPINQKSVGQVFHGDATSSGLKVPANINGYPYCFVSVANFADVTTNTVLSSLASLSTSSCRVQIDVNSGTLRHIAVGSSVQTDTVSVSANKWYGIVCVGDSATSRRTYVCDLAAGTVAASSNTTSATFPAPFTAYSALCSIFDVAPNGTAWSNADTALMCWSQGNPSQDLAIALAKNPWMIFSA